MRFNRNILGCKDLRRMVKRSGSKRFNRNILGCKGNQSVIQRVCV